MKVKFIAHWGWTCSEIMDTPEAALAAVPGGSTPYAVQMYPEDVSFDYRYRIPTKQCIPGFHLSGVKE